MMFAQHCSASLNGENNGIRAETVETLEAAALQLMPTERARLLDRMIPTLDADPEVEEAWAAEVERRQTQVEMEQFLYRLVLKRSPG
jgi:hypothetical protein